MDGPSILIIGVLVVAVVLAITSAIIACAPYVAGGVVIIGLIWFAIKFSDDSEDPSPTTPPVVKPKMNLRE